MSTYLQYNNHMILHPTDPSKYFYGIVEDPPEPPTPSFDEVTIDNITWMAKNLSIDDGGSGIYHKDVDYGQGTVTEYYYTWEAAVRIANSLTEWRLPQEREIISLQKQIANQLKSTYGWTRGNGSNLTGFNAFPAGTWDPIAPDFGETAEFWTGDEYNSTQAYRFYFNISNTMYVTYTPKTGTASVRLVKI